jgi:hypothetical protein
MHQPSSSIIGAAWLSRRHNPKTQTSLSNQSVGKQTLGYGLGSPIQPDRLSDGLFMNLYSRCLHLFFKGANANLLF